VKAAEAEQAKRRSKPGSQLTPSSSSSVINGKEPSPSTSSSSSVADDLKPDQMLGAATLKQQQHLSPVSKE
jgi:hypothetical protein